MRAQGEAVKERPILFSGPMVRAILEGTKTQTRRVVKHIPMLGGPLGWCAAARAQEPGWVHIVGDYRRFCPYGVPGDRLWVRETWSKALHGCGVELLERWEPGKEGPFGVGAIYAATPHPDYKPGKWKPSIHMPRWASRITLEVTGVRVEKLRDISEEDARDEGSEKGFPVKDENYFMVHEQGTFRAGFEHLWTFINGRDSWLINPWVWVVEFGKI